jgi:hypothetical protein
MKPHMEIFCQDLISSYLVYIAVERFIILYKIYAKYRSRVVIQLRSIVPNE